MPITVELMSGEIHTLDIFDGYRIVNIKNEMGFNLHQNRDLITISRRLEDGEYEILDNMNYAEDGCYYYAFIAQEDPLEYYLKFDKFEDDDFQKINIVDENDNIVNYRLPASSIIHVELCDDGWTFLRNILRDDYNRYERMTNLEAVSNYLRILRINGVDIMIHSDSTDNEEDE